MEIRRTDRVRNQRLRHCVAAGVTIGLFGTLLATGPPAAAVPSPVAIAPIADTYANQGAPNTTFGTSTSLASVGGTASITYLRFVLPANPVDGVLTSAVLSLRTTTLASAGSAGQHIIREGSDASDENTVTWNTSQPSAGSTLASFTAPAVNASLSVPLNTSAVSQLSGRQITLTISSTSTDSAWFWSRNYSVSSSRPSIMLSYQAAQTPTPTPTSPTPTPTLTSPTPTPTATATATSTPTATATATSTATATATATSTPTATATTTSVPTPTAPVSPTLSPSTNGIRNLAFGDSIVEGCCGTTTNGVYSGKSISEVWAAALGWSAPIISAQGGTGYLTVGPGNGRSTYPDPIGPVLDANPNLDILVIEARR